MRVPGSTYRVQFSAACRFVDGRDLVPYLNDLGITDLYSSPRYKARRGSSHGYDVTSPTRINSELGTEEDFDEMSAKLRHYGMGLLLDSVPNHMAASYENPWWTDVLENGEASAYAHYFDIDWHPTISKAEFLQADRVLLPILADLYGNVLERGDLSLKIEDTGIYVRYYEKRLPLDPKSYGAILERLPETPRVAELRAAVERLPARSETSAERTLARRREIGRIQERLWTAYRSSEEFQAAMDEALLAIASSPADMDRLMDAQAYRLAYWKIGYEEINYRRFFDINELVGLRVEDPEVFDNRHQRTLTLVRDGKITGLRLDHIDGLWDPECYLRRLAGKAPDLYVVVEKVLGREEDLPPSWPTAGTTGYDFLNALNSIFIEPAGLAKLEEIFGRVTGSHLPFAEQCYRANKLVIHELFLGDLVALGHRLAALAARHRQARDVPCSELNAALIEVTACLPVYRTYIHDFEIADADRAILEQTLARARARTSSEDVCDAAFDFLRAVLLLDPPPYLEDRRKDWLDFVMRYQQFTGPVMAKGLEDTALYRDNTLLSRNEVGSDSVRELPPGSLEEFHQFLRRRRELWPSTMNATATHDTKRGEDARARLNVLSEMPEEWERRLERWMEWNAPRKVAVNGVLAPSVSEEILLYQTLLAAWPIDAERLNEFLTKALREAKENSSWVEPHEDYERAVQEFAARILEDNHCFIRDFQDLQADVARFGVRNSLAQVVLKIAAPGIPDFYQGTELWQFSLVDPDNRRPVDYAKRSAMLEELRRREAEDRPALVRELAAEPAREEMKLWITYRALAFRKRHADMFARGEYLPVTASGSRARHVVAFARRLENEWAVALAPRWTSQMEDWGDTEIVLPEGAPEEWCDALTGVTLASRRVAELLEVFPVALLTA